MPKLPDQVNRELNLNSAHTAEIAAAEDLLRGSEATEVDFSGDLTRSEAQQSIDRMFSDDAFSLVVGGVSFDRAENALKKALKKDKNRKKLKAVMSEIVADANGTKAKEDDKEDDD